MATQPQVTAIRTTQVSELRMVDHEAWDELWKAAFPAQRRQDVTLQVPAVYKDGVYYVPQGALEWKVGVVKETRGETPSLDSQKVELDSGAYL
jgi:hypothetical protein